MVLKDNTQEIDIQTYQTIYDQSVQDPEKFWGQAGQRLHWFTPYTRVKNTSFNPDNVTIRWYEDGVLNAAYNCVDRHLSTQALQPAIIWEGDDPTQKRTITFAELHEKMCRFANVLKELGVSKGDRVILYLPMIPEATIAMLACARIGAIHSVVFGGFSPESLANRIQDCEPKVVITVDAGWRGGRSLDFKKNVDEALARLNSISLKVLVIPYAQKCVPLLEGRDYDYDALTSVVTNNCLAEPMGAEDPLFILYTSGSTGQPKGVVHTTGGYLVYASLTHEQVFNYKPGEIYWCTADIGWITGHSYGVYGPLCNGATTFMYEGVPHYPHVSRFWEIIERHKINIFYTAPTALRTLKSYGDDAVKKFDRSSLKVLGSVGEPIDPTTWAWYHEVVGESRCPIVDTWWQTETGGIMITPLPNKNTQKPGAATWPFYGVQPALVDVNGQVQTGETSGHLVITDSWPGQMRTIYCDHQRFIDTYFKTYPGMYFSGDGAKRDKEGYYWITGRIDDVLNVSGHRLGTAELESSLESHPIVAEAAVVGYPHSIKGQGIYAYIVLKPSISSSDLLDKELVQWVRQQIGPIATLDKIQWAAELPKTRSGKVMRRILRKIADGEMNDLGDLTTLNDVTVVEDLVQGAISLKKESNK